MDLEKRVEVLEKKIAELESRVQEQPKEEITIDEFAKSLLELMKNCNKKSNRTKIEL